jgi:hypothetical protein
MCLICSTLKGLCHEMNNVLKVLTVKSVLYVQYMHRWFITFFGALLWRIWKFKFLLASMKTHKNFEDPY